jgi:AraC-like DNA-binding protein
MPVAAAIASHFASARAGEPPLAELFPWAIERLDHPLTVEDLARQAAMSSRNLGRHFTSVTGTTPLQWLLTQRIRRAQELLETTDDSVELGLAAGPVRRHDQAARDRVYARCCGYRAASPIVVSRWLQHWLSAVSRSADSYISAAGCGTLAANRGWRCA